MPPRVKLVHREASVGVPVDYTLEPGESFEFASVRAKINGAAAAATFVMVLEALSQDGKIITQSPIDQEFAVGDTGALTWAPFLRRQQAAAAASGLPYMRRRKTANQAIVSAGETTVTWGSDTVSDATVFEANGNGIRVKEDGLYSVALRLFWPQWPNAHLGIVNGVDPDGFAGYPIINTNALSQVACSAGAMDFRLPANQTITVTVHHLFGANRNLGTGTYLEVRKLGSATMDGRDS